MAKLNYTYEKATTYSCGVGFKLDKFLVDERESMPHYLGAIASRGVMYNVILV